MKLLNSITNTLEYIPKHKELNWYCCGPTIYNDSHLGHARTYIIFDSIIRYMRTSGYKINYGMNITDIDDKIIKKVNEIYEKDKSVDKNNLYHKFIKEQEHKFFQDLKSLNINMPDKIERVSDVIKEIIDFIQKLIDKNYAYESNGSVYFNNNNFLKKYNQIMSNSNLNDISVKNIFNDDKKNVNDFALWKAEKDDDIVWSSPWGNGRPGWHIECSVMMDKMFNDKIDIHSGGIDLKFPHHHNEYCQTTAYYDNEDIIKTFIHSGHLHINNEKMSQSLNNFITIKNFIKSNNPNILRILFLMNNWNNEFNLTDKAIETAKEYYSIINNFYNNLTFYRKNTTNDLNYSFEKYDKFKLEITNALDNNFKTDSAIKIFFNFINEVNKDYTNKELSKINLDQIMDFTNYFLDIFGIKFDIKNEYNNKDYINSIENIIQIRNDIKSIAKGDINKDTKIQLFKLSDKIRDVILPNLNVKLEDDNNLNKWFFI